MIIKYINIIVIKILILKKNLKIFKSKNLYYIFELNFKDVFKIINNKLYFLIVFSKIEKKIGL